MVIISRAPANLQAKAPSGPSGVEAERTGAPQVERKTKAVPPKKEFIKPVEKGSMAAEHDVALVSQMAFAAHSNELYDKVNAGGQAADEIQNNQALGEVASYSLILRAASEDIKKPIPLDTGTEMRIIISGESGKETFEPSLINGKGTRITSITGKEGDNFVCQTDKGEKKISASLIITQQLIASYRDGKGVREQFSPTEQKIIDAYLESLAGKKEAAEKIDKKELREVALKSGLVSPESVSAFGNANKKIFDEADLLPDAPAEKATVAKANKEFNARIDEALKLMEGQTVASPEAISAVCNVIIPENIQGTDVIITAEIATINAQIKGLNGKDPEAQKPLEARLLELRTFSSLISEARTYFAEGVHVVENFFGQVQRGEVEIATVQVLDIALARSDMQGILGVLLTDKNVDPSKLQKILKKIDLKTIGKYGGGVSLGIFFMLLWKAIKGEGGMMGVAAAG